MNQIIHNFRTGLSDVISTPYPCRSGLSIHICTRDTLVSAGTERMLVEFGRASLLQKARTQPERVKQVLEKVQSDGLLETYDSVRAKLDQPIPLGYCNAGVALEVGPGVERFAPGDRVASNGPHAEIVTVSENLCAKIPDSVTDEEAAFTVLGAIALQGIRLLTPTLGERIVVSGLGMIGLLAVQMLRANGCQVLGIDYLEQRLALAEQFGASTVNLSNGVDPVKAASSFTHGVGVDGVLIAASTDSHDVVHQAAEMCRKRGRIILVGVTGLNLRRADFYEKELTFQVSCSYGPGRYDPEYEEKGHDYPIGFVRWTEQRNMEAVLGLMADGQLDVKPLISHRIPFSEAPEAYRLLTEDPSALGILLTYPKDKEIDRARTISVTESLPDSKATPATGNAVFGVIGAGAYTSRTMLPAIAKTGRRVKYIASSGGTSASIAARKFGAEQATTDTDVLLADPEVNAIVITTRHDSHASIVVQALDAGKNVYVEKPLALDRDQLESVYQAHARNPEVQLMVGFNRRFAPFIVRAKELIDSRSEPLSTVYTVNAGMIPADHWTQDPAIGGGRIIGEACHFIDTLRYLIGYPIVGVSSQMMGGDLPLVSRQDKMSILLDFADGSTGVIHYFANGSKRFPKERIEVFSEGRILVVDNFLKLRGYGWRGLRNSRRLRQNKGHAEAVAAFTERVICGGSPLIPFSEINEVTLATFITSECSHKPSQPLA